MIEAIRALEHWLRANNIEASAVSLTLSAKPMVASQIGFALKRVRDDLSFGSIESVDEVREGIIYGMAFKVRDSE